MGAQKSDFEIRSLNVAEPSNHQGTNKETLKQHTKKKRINLFFKSNYSKSKGIAGNQ